MRCVLTVNKKDQNTIEQDLYDSPVNHEKETTSLEALYLPAEQDAIKCVTGAAKITCRQLPVL